MPARGYRKGLSDSKEPLPHFVRTRLSDREFDALAIDASSRGLTHARLTRAVLSAYLANQRAALPHSRATADLVRQFARIGNNLNQLARQANNGLVAVSADEITRCLSTINTLVQRL